MSLKSALAVVAACIVFSTVAGHATPFNLTLSAGPSVPMGDLAEKEDIIDLGFRGTYNATGGGAETGFVFNVELEVQAASRVYAGGRFGYARLGADASDLVDTFLSINGVTDAEATWTFTTVGLFARVIALETPMMSVYGRGGLGTSKMKNSLDMTFPPAELGGETVSTTTDFDLGSQFYFAGTLGVEYKLSERIHLMSEFRITNLRCEGAEATASFLEYSLTGTQDYNANVFDIVFGVRIPLSGI